MHEIELIEANQGRPLRWGRNRPSFLLGRSRASDGRLGRMGGFSMPIQFLRRFELHGTTLAGQEKVLLEPTVRALVGAEVDLLRKGAAANIAPEGLLARVDLGRTGERRPGGLDRRAYTLVVDEVDLLFEHFRAAVGSAIPWTSAAVLHVPLLSAPFDCWTVWFACCAGRCSVQGRHESRERRRSVAIKLAS